MTAVVDLVTAAVLLLGALFAALAGLGVVRLPDVYTRMHAATKAGTLGAGLALVAVAIHFGDAGITLRVVAALFFLVLTAPVAAHMIGRAAYRSGIPLWEKSVVDDWALQPPPRSARERPAMSDDGPRQPSA